MTKKYIRQHMGLGDHIICNGLVRYFCEKYDDIAIFCKDSLYENIKFMFRDIKHLNVIPFQDKNLNGYCEFYLKNGKRFLVDNLSDLQSLEFIKNNEIDFDNDVINIGFEGLGGLNTRFDKAFYKMHGFDPSFRLDNFYCERNFEYEDYVFNFLNPNKEKYIFVVDDDKHHFGSLTIDENKLPKGYKIIKYDKTLNYNDNRFLMYNYRKILENAEEVHMFQSAFSEFVNSIELKSPKIYFHLYLRDYTDGEPILSKNNLHILR